MAWVVLRQVASLVMAEQCLTIAAGGLRQQGANHGLQGEAKGVARWGRMPLVHGFGPHAATVRRKSRAEPLNTWPRLRPSSMAMLCAWPRRHL